MGLYTSIKALRYSLAEPVTRNMVNRTGATLVRGDLVALDLTGSDGDVQAYTAFTPGTHEDSAHPFSNVIACATAQIASGWVFAVTIDSSIINDASGEFGLFGVFDVEMVGSSAVSLGENVTPTNAQTYVSGGVDAQVNVGIALEAGPTGTAAATGKVLFDGWALNTTGVA